jgi:hypothetical protein
MFCFFDLLFSPRFSFCTRACFLRFRFRSRLLYKKVKFLFFWKEEETYLRFRLLDDSNERKKENVKKRKVRFLERAAFVGREARFSTGPNKTKPDKPKKRNQECRRSDTNWRLATRFKRLTRFKRVR